MGLIVYMKTTCTNIQDGGGGGGGGEGIILYLTAYFPKSTKLCVKCKPHTTNICKGLYFTRRRGGKGCG